MTKENGLNTAIAVFLADKVFPMSPEIHLILTVALGALIGRLVWTWISPTWARYPATVTALAALSVLVWR